MSLAARGEITAVSAEHTGAVLKEVRPEGLPRGLGQAASPEPCALQPVTAQLARERGKRAVFMATATSSNSASEGRSGSSQSRKEHKVGEEPPALPPLFLPLQPRVPPASSPPLKRSGSFSSLEN